MNWDAVVSMYPPPGTAPETVAGDPSTGTQLHAHTLRGGIATLSGQGVRFVLQLGTMAVLARLLTPADYGTVALATAIVALALTFTDMGLSAATVQTRTLSHGQVSTLFWINLALSVCLSLVVVACAPALATLFGNPALAGVTAALSGTILVAGFSAQHTALLQRTMRFGALTRITVTASAGGAAAAITSALLGAGYWSLVVLAGGTSLLTAAGVWIAMPWRPGRPVRGSGVRSMLGFGAHLAGFNFVNYFARKADDLLIGWALGAAPLGLYNRAYQLLSAPMSQLNAPASGVVVPALSRLQASPRQYITFYRGAVGLVVGVGMPLVGFLLVAADDVVLLAFGPKWADTVPIFRALAPAAFAAAANMVVGWVYMSLGNTRRMFRWGMVAVPLIVLSFLVGLPYGAIGVAVSYSVAIVALWFASLWYCFRATYLTMSDALSAVWRPFLAASTAAIGCLAARGLVEALGHVSVRLLVMGATYAIAYFGAWAILPGGRRMFGQACLLISRELRCTQTGPRADTVNDERSPALEKGLAR